jgi:hypothetical protein
VGDGEAVDVDIADGEGGAGLEEFELGDEFAPGDRGCGEARAIDGNAKLLRDGGEAGDVVGMFVRYKDSVEGFGIDSNGGQALKSFFAAETCVDEDAGSRGGDEGGISGAG